MHTTATVLAEGWFTTLTTLGDQMKRLLVEVVVPLIAMALIARKWSETRSGPAALVAILLGAIVIWGVTNIVVLSNKTGDTLNGGAARITGVVSAPAHTGSSGGHGVGGVERL
jgi:hypothetical protein